MLPADLISTALQSAPDAILIVDDSGSIRYANLQALKLFGYPAEQLLGSTVDALLPERLRTPHPDHRRNYARNGRMRPMGSGLDLFARRADGTEFPVEISLSPIRSDTATLVAAAIRDITDRKRVEAAVLQARAEADEAQQIKSRFLATASHDLRQPLQSLALLNASLRRLVRDPVGLDALDQQSLAIEAMSRLLNSLLDISKLESGAVRPEIADFGVTALFAELRSEYQEIAHGKGLELEFESGDHVVRSDAALVGQIMRNLLSNALKYTQRGGVRVVARRAHQRISLEVRDSGVGIAPDQLNRIYDEFYQIGVNPNAVRNGYGLGLSIVRRLVSLLDAVLSVDSQPGAGSTFALLLPEGSLQVGSGKAPAAAAAISPAAPVRGCHVLLVEDDPGVRNATRIFLTLEGFRVSAQPSLEAAVGLATQSRDIDVIVTDYHLGGTTRGTDVIAAIRTLLGREVPAVLMTGDTSAATADIQTGETLQVVRKPVQSGELLAILRQFTDQ